MSALTGLRGRLLLAVVATSLATLGVTGLVVLPQLQRRVENVRLDELRGLARTIRPELRALPEHARHRGSPELGRLVERLQRRAGGRIIIYDAAGAELADTVAGAREPIDARRAEAMRRHDGVASGARGGTAYAMTVAGRPEPLTLVITKRIDGPRVADEVLRAALPVALAAGLAVSLLLALLVSGGLLRRLGRLQDDAEALGSEGLSHAVRTGGHDEVAVVARALEAMRGRLVEEQAARARFVSTASHELRTPLSSLVLTLELLREEIDRGTPSIERADTALRQTHRLTALATDLLDISRTDSGPDLRLEPLELAELATGVADEFLPRLESLGRGVHVEGDPALALADAAAATRILRVLLDNAASYGAGQVVVSVRPEPGCVRLSVEDEGSGVGDDERERVFGRFTRGRAAGATHGAGLGLAIARALARAMNGDLEATGGARIVLSLPAA